MYYYYPPPPWLPYATSEPFHPSIRRRVRDTIKALLARVKLPTLINESAHTERISRNYPAIFGMSMLILFLFLFSCYLFSPPRQGRCIWTGGFPKKDDNS